MAKALSSASVIIVVHDAAPQSAVLDALSEQLEKMFVDFEFIVVANDVAPSVSLELKALSQHLPDSLIVFLGDHVHDDLARLIGIDHAVSDYVLFTTPSMTEAENVGIFEQPLRAGCDLAIGVPPVRSRRGAFNRALFTAFSTLFRWTTGRVFEDEPAAFRILSRSAALYIATRSDGEVLVRARQLGSGFPSASLPLPPDPLVRSERRSLRRDLARGARFITTGSTTLLRVSSYLAFAGGIASTFYAAYVIAIYIAMPGVAEGWTTLSLQLSGMLLLFSIQFLLLSEHVLQISGTAGAGNRRHHIVRELRSARTRRGARLNVVDQEGRFELGAPTQLTGREGASRQ